MFPLSCDRQVFTCTPHIPFMFIFALLHLFYPITEILVNTSHYFFLFFHIFLFFSSHYHIFPLKCHRPIPPSGGGGEGHISSIYTCGPRGLLWTEKGVLAGLVCSTDSVLYNVDGYDYIIVLVLGLIFIPTMVLTGD
jgi:hypothetical protein